MVKFNTLLVILLITSFQLVAQKNRYPTTIIVAQDGNGDYQTIQAAVNSTRDLGTEQVYIYIKNGVYNEKLIVPSWKTNISLIGEDKKNTIISNDDYSGKPVTNGPDQFGNDKFSTFTSYTTLVQGNDITIKNLTIRNTAGPVGQAVALHVEGDRVTVINCQLLGNQDTLYAATENSRQYYRDCYIEGTTDFIFGAATALFENCIINSLKDSYITAAATTPNQMFGFVFMGCKLIAAPSVTKVFLGRPWRPYAKTVFVGCDIGSHILAEGWDPWKGDAMFPDKEKTTRYREFENSGPGAATKGRVAWSKELSAKEAKRYTLKNILGGVDHWTPDITDLR